jgi:8-hydroxy-5-deazaflavin:NADPH oxidoreductase
MQVTVIGAGNMGRGIGHRLVAGGHSVTVVDRDPEEAGRLAEELRGVAEGDATVEAAGPGAELRGEVVILAVYYPGTLEIAGDLGDRLAGKIVVDISNPLNQTFGGLATAPGTSAAEELAAALPAGARVVKAFNTTFSGTLVEEQVAGQQLDVLLAGDAEGAKETVAQLVRDGGLRAIDTGSLERARQLEGLGFLHITLQQTLGTGFGSAVKILA